MKKKSLEQTNGPENKADPGELAAEELAAEELALRVQQGSKICFTELVNRFGPRLFGYFRQKVNNREDCEDLVQETFVKAYRYIHRYDPSRSFDPWLFTIGTRLVVDHFRTRERGRTAPISPEPVASGDPYEFAARRDEIDSLWVLAGSLPRKQHDALWLRYVEEMSVPEIARVLKITRVHVKVLLFRARSRLARKRGVTGTLRRGPGAKEPIPEVVPIWRGVER